MEALPDLPGGDIRGFAMAISGDGHVIAGRAAGKGNWLEAFRWEAGEIRPLGATSLPKVRTGVPKANANVKPDPIDDPAPGPKNEQD